MVLYCMAWYCRILVMVVLVYQELGDGGVGLSRAW